MGHLMEHFPSGYRRVRDGGWGHRLRAGRAAGGAGLSAGAGPGRERGAAGVPGCYPTARLLGRLMGRERSSGGLVLRSELQEIQPTCGPGAAGLAHAHPQGSGEGKRPSRGATEGFPVQAQTDRGASAPGHWRAQNSQQAGGTHTVTQRVRGSAMRREARRGPPPPGLQEEGRGWEQPPVL